MSCAFGKIRKGEDRVPCCASAPVLPRPVARSGPIPLSLAALVAGAAAYAFLDPVSRWLAFDVAGLKPQTAPGDALQFFLFETPKVLLLMAGVVFAMTLVRSFFPAHKIRAALADRRGPVANIPAALFGIVTPFCSCSAVPLFIGFLTAGVPLGVTFSFLISAPMVNEIALGLLLSLFGWRIAGLYLITGVGIAVVSGWIIGLLRMERHVEAWVYEEPAPVPGGQSRTTWDDRIRLGWKGVVEIVGRVWVYILVGIAVGAGIHGYVPADFMATIMDGKAWWSVPLAVLVGVPMYSNAAAILPIVQALLGKGAALGTTLAFMMSVIALSLPEMIILRRVLRVPLILTFVGVVATGILLVGYAFNFLFTH
jgi:uncharacterized membrane protein YraQ (UPF0718 family)